MCDGVKKDCGGDGVDGGVLPRQRVRWYHYTGEQLCSTARHCPARAQTAGRSARASRGGVRRVDTRDAARLRPAAFGSTRAALRLTCI